MTRTEERLPLALSARSASTAALLFQRNGAEIDVAVGGLPFRLAVSSELPSTVETVPVRKDQFDAEADPGEQSLSGWWRRSQDSFHGGAGSLYAESRLSTDPGISFFDSEGVDVFTKNKVTLLRQMAVMDAATGFSRLNTYTSSGTTKISAVKGGKLYTSPDKTTAFTALHSPATTIVDGFVAGTTFFDVASDGTLYRGLVSSPGTATSWPCGAAVTRLAFGKGRLWAIGGRKLWQPDLSLASGTSQPAIFTHPNDGWTYTCIAEGPSAMYFGGHDGRSSTIQAVELANDGTVPTLSGARVTAVLPDGELVQEIVVLAGQYMGIGTSKGFRIGVFDGSTLTYGPLLITPAGVTACAALTTQDRFFLVSFTTAAGTAVAYKVDTGTSIADGIFPYAKNVQVGSSAGTLTSLAVLGNDVLACDSTGAVYAQSTSTLVATGFLQTGRIRFRTNEKKVFKYVEIETAPLHGSIVIAGLEETGTSFDIGVFNTAGDVAAAPWGITTELGPLRQMALKFTFTRDAGDATKGPELNSFLLRAVPAAKPQRLYTLPLLCFDYESARSGQRYGNEGFSEERLAALHELEDRADVVTFQDFRKKSVTGVSVVIDSVRYVQTSTGQQYNTASGIGGVIVIQLRTVAA